jgi:hypothetical protein
MVAMFMGEESLAVIFLVVVSLDMLEGQARRCVWWLGGNEGVVRNE